MSVEDKFVDEIREKVDPQNENQTEIVLLRTKLEARSLMLRASIALNIALLSGFMFFLLNLLARLLVH